MATLDLERSLRVHGDEVSGSRTAFPGGETEGLGAVAQVSDDHAGGQVDDHTHPDRAPDRPLLVADLEDEAGRRVPVALGA
jgi:hypothetical protein